MTFLFSCAVPPSTLTKKIYTLFYSVLYFLLSFLIVANAAGQENQIIFKLKSEYHSTATNKCAGSNTLCLKGIEKLSAHSSVLKTTKLSKLVNNGTFVVEFSKGQDLDAIIQSYNNSGMFEYVEKDFIASALASTTPQDANFAMQWNVNNNGQYNFSSKLDADMDVLEAWDIEKGSADIIVAILDTGIKYDHPDLKNRMWTNTQEYDNGNDSDANGYIDDTKGWDFANEDNDPTDGNGHGTHVAGIIGAEANNGIGYTGIDWNCKLMPLKVVKDNNTASYSDYAEAVYYAVAKGAKVINMSLTSYSHSSTIEEAFKYAYDRGVVIVVAMSNDGDNTTHYMAKSPYTIAVGATTPMDERASYSNYNTYIDVVAPGSRIYGLNKNNFSDLNYYLQGTSQAAPAVAAISSLLLAQDPSRSPQEIKQLIRSTAEDQVGKASEDTPGHDYYHGYGRVNAFKALSAGIPCIDADQDGFCGSDDPDDSDACNPDTSRGDCAVANCGEFNKTDFESPGHIWILGGSDSYVYNKFASSGSSALRIQDNSGQASSIYTKNQDLSGISQVEISFSAFPVSMERWEDYMLEVSTNGGEDFTEIQKWVSGVDFTNSIRKNHSVVVADINFSSQTVFRLRCDASSNSDYVIIDDIIINACGTDVTSNETTACQVGTPCDDGDVCTIDDVIIDADCNCAGTYVDADQDGVCIGEDPDDNNVCVPFAENCQSQTNDVSDCGAISEDQFESGMGAWIDGGSDVYRYAGNANSGSYSVRLQDNSGKSSSMYTPSTDYSAYESLELKFSFYPVSMERGEDLIFEISNDGGNSFTVVKSWASVADFTNLIREEVVVSVEKNLLSSATVLRLRADASSNSDQVFIDDVVISGCTGNVEDGGSISSFVANKNTNTFSVDAVTLYPNPTVDYIFLQVDEVSVSNSDTVQIKIVNNAGQLVLTNKILVGEEDIVVDVSSLAPENMYHIVLSVPTGASFTSSFIKL